MNFNKNLYRYKFTITCNYVGKSIIRNAVVLVFLLAALVVLRRWRMRGFLSLFLHRFDAARLVPSSRLAVKHGCSAFCVHQGRATFSYPVFLWSEPGGSS